MVDTGAKLIDGVAVDFSTDVPPNWNVLLEGTLMNAEVLGGVTPATNGEDVINAFSGILETSFSLVFGAPNINNPGAVVGAVMEVIAIVPDNDGTVPVAAEETGATAKENGGTA